MKLIVTEEAVQLFKDEWDFTAGDEIRIYPRYTGGGGDAFGVGAAKMKPRFPGLVQEAGGIAFFIEQDDLWLLNDQETFRITARNGEIVYETE